MPPDPTIDIPQFVFRQTVIDWLMSWGIDEEAAVVWFRDLEPRLVPANEPDPGLRAALDDAIETEWHNGNIDNGAYFRLRALLGADDAT